MKVKDGELYKVYKKKLKKYVKKNLNRGIELKTIKAKLISNKIESNLVEEIISEIKIQDEKPFQLKKKLLVALFVFLLLLFLLEIITRFVLIKQIYSWKFNAPNIDSKFNSYYLKPSSCFKFNMSNCQSYNLNYYSTNSDGLRGEKIIYNNSCYTIFIVGDSLTFGSLRYHNETLSYNLNNKLKNHYKKQCIQVLNLGVPVYSPEQYLWKYKQVSKKIKPNLTIVNIVPNDYFDFTLPKKEHKTTTLLGYYYMYSLLNQRSFPISYLLYHSYLFRYIDFSICPNQKAICKLNEGFIIYNQRFLKKIKNQAYKDQSKLIFVLFPEYPFSHDFNLMLGYNEDFCLINDIQCINIMENMQLNNLSLYFLKENSHYLNPIGIQYVVNNIMFQPTIEMIEN